MEEAKENRKKNPVANGRWSRRGAGRSDNAATEFLFTARLSEREEPPVRIRKRETSGIKESKCEFQRGKLAKETQCVSLLLQSATAGSDDAKNPVPSISSFHFILSCLCVFWL